MALVFYRCTISFITFSIPFPVVAPRLHCSVVVRSGRTIFSSARPFDYITLINWNGTVTCVPVMARAGQPLASSPDTLSAVEEFIYLCMYVRNHLFTTASACVANCNTTDNTRINGQIAILMTVEISPLTTSAKDKGDLYISYRSN